MPAPPVREAPPAAALVLAGRRAAILLALLALARVADVLYVAPAAVQAERELTDLRAKADELGRERVWLDAYAIRRPLAAAKQSAGALRSRIQRAVKAKDRPALAAAEDELRYRELAGGRTDREAQVTAGLPEARGAASRWRAARVSWSWVVFALGFAGLAAGFGAVRAGLALPLRPAAGTAAAAAVTAVGIAAATGALLIRGSTAWTDLLLGALYLAFAGLVAAAAVSKAIGRILGEPMAAPAAPAGPGALRVLRWPYLFLLYGAFLWVAMEVIDWDDPMIPVFGMLGAVLVLVFALPLPGTPVAADEAIRQAVARAPVAARPWTFVMTPGRSLAVLLGARALAANDTAGSAWRSPRVRRRLGAHAVAGAVLFSALGLAWGNAPRLGVLADRLTIPDPVRPVLWLAAFLALGWAVVRIVRWGDRPGAHPAPVGGLRWAPLLTVGGASLGAVLAGAVVAGFAWDTAGRWPLRMAEAALRADGVNLAPPANQPAVAAGKNAAEVLEAIEACKSVKADTAAGTPFVYRTMTAYSFASWYLEWTRSGSPSAEDRAAAVKFVAARQDVLDLLARSAALDGIDWHVDWRAGSENLHVPRYTPFVQAARIAALDAILRARRGDGGRAIREIRDGLRMANAIGVEPLLIAQMVRAAADGILLRAAEDVLPWVDSGEAVRFWEPCLGTAGLNPAYIRTMDERFAGMARSAQAQAGRTLRHPTANGWDGLYLPFIRFDVASYLRNARGELRALRLPFRDERAAHVAIAADDGLGLWRYAAQDRARPNTLHEEFLAGIAWREVARASLAAKRFKNARGRWPDRVADLEDATHRFRDPFTGGRLLLVRLNAGIGIYSVGPDLADDQGAPFEASSMSGDIGWTVK